MNIQRLIEQSWLKSNVLTALLWPLSMVYRVLFGLRRWCYRLGLFSSFKASMPVIIVGNLTVGGTGKTPLVIHLVEELRRLGFKPGVISRGYGGNAPSYPCAVTNSTPVAHSGDEPALIVRRTGISMVVGADRRAAIELLLQQSDIDIIISDDGLQHLALQRDLEVCLVDSTSPNTNAFLLPAGPYREHRSRLKSVDLVVNHGLPNDTEAAYAMNLNASAPQPVSPESVSDGGVVFDSGEHFHAVAGIGNPQRFFNTCRSLGYHFDEHPFADHHSFKVNDFEFATEQVLMTEKDAVKCQAFADSRHWYLPVDATLSNDFSKALAGLLSRFQ